ncbi:MAG: hypothetical protein M5U28_18550 [Sandaracinaceae bacterium]|nr:hypothetical protein [Sandaracinaceae bacterium]
MRSFALVCALSMSTLACSGPAADPDAGAADAGADAAVPGDAGLPWPRPVAPLTEPAPLEPAWLTGWTGGTNDPLIGEIEAGTFEVPAAEGLAYGLDWVSYDPGETHAFDGRAAASTGRRPSSSCRRGTASSRAPTARSRCTSARSGSPATSTEAGASARRWRPAAAIARSPSACSRAAARPSCSCGPRRTSSG